MRLMILILVLNIACVSLSSSLDTAEGSGVWNYMKGLNPFGKESKGAEVEDKCRMKCDQNETLVHKPNVTMEINGCGSYHVYVDMQNFGFHTLNPCCDDHDYCYRNCYTSKKICDAEFHGCLKQACAFDEIDNMDEGNFFTRYFRKKSCRSITKIMGKLVDRFGCPAFIKDQTKYCKCE